MGRQKVLVIIGSSGKVGRSKFIGHAALAEERYIRTSRSSKVLLSTGFDGRRLRQLVCILPGVVAA